MELGAAPRTCGSDVVEISGDMADVERWLGSVVQGSGAGQEYDRFDETWRVRWMLVGQNVEKAGDDPVKRKGIHGEGAKRLRRSRRFGVSLRRSRVAAMKLSVSPGITTAPASALRIILAAAF